MEQEDRLKAALADRYQIEWEIGSGGMATVDVAQDLKHDRQVAVKVPKAELAAEEVTAFRGDQMSPADRTPHSRRTP